jgi:hypothetical protein
MQNLIFVTINKTIHIFSTGFYLMLRHESQLCVKKTTHTRIIKFITYFAFHRFFDSLNANKQS